ALLGGPRQHRHRTRCPLVRPRPGADRPGHVAGPPGPRRSRGPPRLGDPRLGGPRRLRRRGPRRRQLRRRRRRTLTRPAGAGTTDRSSVAAMGPTELIVILVIVLVLFGGAMLPKLAKNIGQAGKELRSGLKDDDTTSEDDTDA